VLPHVWYGTTYLLIRNTIGCVSCSEWELAWCFTQAHMVQEGLVGGEGGGTLALQMGPMVGNHRKA
jgi:hypothetical protein